MEYTQKEERCAPPVNMLSVDVEDWFQVENLKPSIQGRWDDKELRVEANTNRILQIFSENNVKATFFVLGWIAERLPGLVREIAAQGHEIASHGCSHELIYNSGIDSFREDLLRSKAMLEDIAGIPVTGYRAPSFSITDEALDVLHECGFIYDSSYFAFGAHDRYGKLSTPHTKDASSCVEVYPSGLLEIPMATAGFAGRQLPVSGGGYFRLMPYGVFRALFEKAQNQLGNAVFYIHPWECDPGQPRVDDVKLSYRFRHYVGLSRTEGRLRRLTQDFTFTSISDFINNHR